jgi:hypothetical protein
VRVVRLLLRNNNDEDDCRAENCCDECRRIDEEADSIMFAFLPWFDQSAANNISSDYYRRLYYDNGEGRTKTGEHWMTEDSSFDAEKIEGE